MPERPKNVVSPETTTNAGAEGESATTEQTGTEVKRQQEHRSGATVLSLSFDFDLTASDLRKLTPEQITALYKAVGEVYAIKDAIAR
jgi:hypothetical protein